MEENRMPCTVIQDLMPLVCDGAGSKESEEMVSAHIASCAECRKVWELLHRRDSSLSPSADDSAEKQGFRKSMEKQRRKFNIWRAAAILCALVVLCAGIFVAVNPSILSEQTEKPVPVSMFQNARLIATKQGFLFLRFTPDKDFPAISGMNCELALDLNTQTVQTVHSEYDYQFFYNALAHKPKGTDPFVGLMARLPDGDAVYMLGFRYMRGKLMMAETVKPEKWRDYVEEDRALMLEAMGAEPCCYKESAKIDLYLTDGRERVSLYRAGDTIPLCDEETQAAIDGFFRDGKLWDYDLLSCLYAGDESDAAMQEELKKMQDYQLSLYVSKAE